MSKAEKILGMPTGKTHTTITSIGTSPPPQLTRCNSQARKFLASSLNYTTILPIISISPAPLAEPPLVRQVSRARAKVNAILGTESHAAIALNVSAESAISFSKANQILGTDTGTVVDIATPPAELSKSNKILGTRFETGPASTGSIEKFLDIISSTKRTDNMTLQTCSLLFSILDVWSTTAGSILRAPSNGTAIGHLLVSSASQNSSSLSAHLLEEFMREVVDLAKERMEEEFETEERMAYAVTWILAMNVERVVREETATEEARRVDSVKDVGGEGKWFGWPSWK